MTQVRSLDDFDKDMKRVLQTETSCVFFKQYFTPSVFLIEMLRYSVKCFRLEKRKPN